MVSWKMLHPMMTMAHLGYIPSWLDDENPKDARAQLGDGYIWGGWKPFHGDFRLNANNSLSYPGDPILRPVAQAELRDETIVIYPHSWVAVVQKDRSFEIMRMD